MRFRPCIDIHNGKVKQIIGSSLSDAGDKAAENYVAGHDADWFASLFAKDGLTGGHVIGLNARTSEYYEATKEQMLLALQTFPGGLMAGGGITPENAAEYLDAGASHVIVTSYVFRDGDISYGNLEKLVHAVGKEHLCLDLSCKKAGERAEPALTEEKADCGICESYFVSTDRWQKMSKTQVTPAFLTELSDYCDEFLIHAVDVEGKQAGVDDTLLSILADSPVPVTYAGGVGRMEDLEAIRRIGRGRVDVTIGSALSIYGGRLPYEDVVRYFEHEAIAFDPDGE